MSPFDTKPMLSKGSCLAGFIREIEEREPLGSMVLVCWSCSFCYGRGVLNGEGERRFWDSQLLGRDGQNRLLLLTQMSSADVAPCSSSCSGPSRVVLRAQCSKFRLSRASIISDPLKIVTYLATRYTGSDVGRTGGSPLGSKRSSPPGQDICEDIFEHVIHNTSKIRKSSRDSKSKFGKYV